MGKLLFTESYESDRADYYRRHHLRRLEKARAGYERRNALRRERMDKRRAEYCRYLEELALYAVAMPELYADAYEDAVEDCRFLGIRVIG